MGRRLRDFAQQRISLLPMTQHFLVKFADVIHLSTSRTADPLAAGIERYVGLEHIEPENLHIRSWGNVADGTTFTNTFKSGQVLFGKRRAYQRKVAVADFDGVCSSDIYVFESKDPNVLLPELVPFICQSEGFYDYAVKTSAGSLSPRTNWSHLANYEFPLPPVDEQRRIADLLWAADDAIQKQDELLVAAHKTKEALRQEFLSKGMAAISEKAKSQPNTWVEIPLRDACVAIIDCPHKTPNFVNSGVLVLRNFNIKNGQIVLDDPSYTTEEEYLERIRRLEPKPGDVVFSREAPVGESAVIPENMRISLGQRTMMFRPKEEILASQFLVEYLYAPKSQHKLLSFSTGTTAPHVNVEDMRSFLIKLPPIEEQKEMVKVIRSFDNSIHAVEENLKNLKNVKSQILNTYLA
jgi:type I restriction enzyme S subunit